MLISSLQKELWKRLFDKLGLTDRVSYEKGSVDGLTPRSNSKCSY